MTFSPDDDNAHSTIVGGSSAARRLGCPGSYQLEQKLPKAVKKKSSIYADEGTAMHAAIEHILRENCDVDEVRGMEFAGFVITSEMIDEGIGPAMDYFEALEAELVAEDGDFEFVVEQRCEMPGIPNAFGTSDIIFKTPKRSGVVDWKFGVGKAVYADIVEEGGIFPHGRGNAQGKFYARAAMHTLPDMFIDDPDWPVEIHIVQPRLRSGENYDKVTVTVRELKEFRDLLVRAVAEAKSGDKARLDKGDWCTFCDAKAICPAWTGAALDFAKLQKPTQAQLDGELVAMLLDLVFANEEQGRAVLSMAHVFMEEGNAVPGYKLVAKRPTESYSDEAGAQKMAITAGVKPDDTYAPRKLKSPAQLRAVLADQMEGGTKKAREEAAKKAISAFTSSVSSGTTVAFEDDKREAITPTPAALADLSKRLAALAGKQG